MKYTKKDPVVMHYLLILIVFITSAPCILFSNPSCPEPWQEWTSSGVFVRENPTENGEKWIVIHDRGHHQEYLYPSFKDWWGEVDLAFLDMPGTMRMPKPMGSAYEDLREYEYYKALPEVFGDAQWKEANWIVHGMAAYDVLELYKDSTELFNKLVLVSPPPLQGEKEFLLSHLEDMQVLALWNELDTYNYEKNDQYKTLATALFYKPYNFSKVRGWAGFKPGLFDFLLHEMPEEWDYTDYVGDDVTLIKPELSPFPNSEVPETSQTFTVEEAGHYIWLENPAKWQEILEKLVE